MPEQIDLEVDFANEDETGSIWAWLDRATNPARVTAGALLRLRDGEDLADGEVVDLVPAANGTIVHLRLLGAVG